MPTWPTTNSMPQVLPIETAEKSDPNIVQTQMDVGPPKFRRRFTSIVRHIQVPSSRFLLTDAQRNDLLSFHDSNCDGGSLAFDWGSTGPMPEFDGNTTQRFRFEGRPESLCIRGGTADERLYQVTLKLEITP